MLKENDIKYLKNLNIKITGDTLPEGSTIQDYIENIVGYFTKIIKALPNNVYWLDKNLILRGGNDNLAHKLNLKSNIDLVGLTYDQMAQLAKLPSKELESFRVTEHEVMKTGVSSINKEESSIKVGEKTFYYLSNKTPLLNKNGEITGIVGISIDITQLKETQAALEIALRESKVANKAKTEFLENMGHDLRTPLLVIIGYAHLIQAQSNHPKKIEEYATDLVASSNALLEILDEILESIKISTGKVSILNKRLNLYKIFEQTIRLHKPRAKTKSINLHLVYDKNIPECLLSDPMRLQRIILELVTNALKYTEKGEVKISARLIENKTRAGKLIIELGVSDTGLGIPKDKYDDIYTRFTRLTRSSPGTGLGLAIVKQFIEELEGEIHLESQINQGSTFTCLIPMQESLSPTIEKKPEIFELQPIPATAEYRVLLIEDNPVAIKITQRILLEVNCQVDIAQDGKMVLILLEKNNYDLILMDLELPDSDGYNLTRCVRLKECQHNPSVPIIGLTAYIGQERKQQCLDAGMNTILYKPLKKETIQELLAKFVQHNPADKENLAIFTVINGQVIDFEELKKTLQNEQLIEQCRQLMITGLSNDLLKLTGYYEAEDWESIKSIAHKWLGSASYYSAKRLKQACKNFNDYWALSKKKQRKILYEQLAQEMEAVREVCINKFQ